LTNPSNHPKIRAVKPIPKDNKMGELKIVYSDKKVTPFGGFKL